MVASLGAGESHARGHRFAELKTVFDDALFYSRSQKAFAQNRLRPLAAAALDLEAVIPVARGEKPLFLRVNRRSDIRAAVRWAQEKNIQLVLVGAREAWKEAERLAQAQVPVILNPVLNAPSNFDALGTRSDAAVALEKAGVKYAFSTFSTHQVRKLRQWAGNAVREVVLRCGHESCDVAYRVDRFVFTRTDRARLCGGFGPLVGDPFEFSTQVHSVFIAGHLVSKEHRQKALFDRYRHLRSGADP